jgi:hypothetical protein
MDISEADQRDLDIARHLISQGIPIFSAPPCPPDCRRPGHQGRPGTYHLPTQWEKTIPAQVWLEKWQPGWALGLVGGRVVDVLDVDPRNNGDQSLKELINAGHLPITLGEQRTPSGGSHLLIPATGERKETGFMPGLDLQAGTPERTGTAFAYIAPTTRPSKNPHNLGQLGRYEWVTAPDITPLADYGPDEIAASLEGVISRVHAARARTRERPARGATADPGDPFASPSDIKGARGGTGGGTAGAGRDVRQFTEDAARAFVRPALDQLATARIGGIEEACNRAAVTLAHFIPTFWTVDEGMRLLRVSLNSTAYDENGPSDWTVGKFRAVLDGTRPALDGWVASRAPVSGQGGAADGGDGVPPADDAYQRLLSKMCTAQEMANKPNPVPLIHGLLDMNTESWLIGEPGSLKSFIALDWAAHVSLGKLWHGKKVRKAGVLYIAAEGAQGMTLRTRAWMKTHGDMGDIAFLPYPVQVVSNDNEWGALVRIASEIPNIGLVVIDTQARVSVGLDENSATEMGVLIRAVSQLKDATGACVLVVHHTGRKGDHARGSSAVDGAQDSELKVVRAEPRDSLMCKVVQDKQKDMAEIQDGTPLQLQVVNLGVDEETGRELSSLIVDAKTCENDAYDKIQGSMNLDVEPWVGKDPEDWTARIEGVGKRDKLRRRILQALHDHAAQRGLTRTDARVVVEARWYGKGQTALDSVSWLNAWNKVTSLPIAVNVGGERWALDEVEVGQG